MARARVGKATPQQAGAAWNAGFSAGAANAQATINAGNVQWAGPTLAAESQISSGIAQAFASGRWRSGVQQTGDQGWKQGMIQKGIPHMQAGSQAGQQHYAAFRAQWDGFVQQVVAGLPARGTYEQNKQRSNAVQDAFHQAKGKYRGLWKRGVGG